MELFGTEAWAKSTSLLKGRSSLWKLGANCVRSNARHSWQRIAMTLTVCFVGVCILLWGFKNYHSWNTISEILLTTYHLPPFTVAAISSISVLCSRDTYVGHGWFGHHWSSTHWAWEHPPTLQHMHHPLIATPRDKHGVGPSLWCL